MHHLQQHILHQLIRHSQRRYADLKPAEIEGNLFMYHLRQLIRLRYVAKRADGLYELTPTGHRYADGLSLETFAPRAQPKIVTLLACRNEAGEWLLLRRSRQPLLGMVGFPYGKIHLGESIAEASARELAEKAGLTAELVHRGDGYITIRQAGEPISQIMFHLFYGENPQGQLVPESRFGTAFWARPEEAGESVMPSVPELIRLLQTDPNRFFVELTYDLA